MSQTFLALRQFGKIFGGDDSGQPFEGVQRLIRRRGQKCVDDNTVQRPGGEYMPEQQYVFGTPGTELKTVGLKERGQFLELAGGIGDGNDADELQGLGLRTRLLRSLAAAFAASSTRGARV